MDLPTEVETNGTILLCNCNLQHMHRKCVSFSVASKSHVGLGWRLLGGLTSYPVVVGMTCVIISYICVV